MSTMYFVLASGLFPAGILVRIEPFSMRNSPSSSVPAMIVSPVTASDVTASPRSIGVSHTDDATSNRSTVSEKYPAT